MIEPPADVVSHPINVDNGQVATVLVTPRQNVAFVYGDDDLEELTLVIRARCPFAGDVLHTTNCRCGDDSRLAVSLARRAPLGAYVYLEDYSVDAIADAILLASALTGVKRVYMPFPDVGTIALLLDATDLQVLHAPTIYPTDDPYWPRPGSAGPRWHTQLRDRFGRTIKEVLGL